MKLNNLAKNAILMALYIVFISLNPIGFMALQFRIGEAFAVIPFFNRKYVPALVIGGILANYTSPLGIVDMAVGGACAIITYTISKFVKNNYVNAAIYSGVAAVIVAIELYYVASLPIIASMISIFISMIVITEVAVLLVDKTRLKEIIVNS